MDRCRLVITNHELELTTLTCPAKRFSKGDPQRDLLPTQDVYGLALLNCSFTGDHLARPALLYQHTGNDANVTKVIRYPRLQPFRIPAGNETGERVYDNKYHQSR